VPDNDRARGCDYGARKHLPVLAPGGSFNDYSSVSSLSAHGAVCRTSLVFASAIDFGTVVGVVTFFGLLGGALGLTERFLA
jgi:hypothetical protein